MGCFPMNLFSIQQIWCLVSMMFVCLKYVNCVDAMQKQDMKKQVINEIHIKVHVGFAIYLEKQLRKKYNSKVDDVIKCTSDDSEKVRKGKTEIKEAQEIKAETKAGYTCPAVDTICGISPTHSTERIEQVNYQINQNEILLSLSVIQEEFRMELTLQINNTQTQILCSQYIAEISLSRVNEHEQEETDQRVMTLFPALNLEALRVAADTLVPRFIPAIPKMKEVTKITSEVNNVSSSAELTQVV
ncbi:Hypothetical_protein [Hexamita inflata]|uniref:Hypothetical_protein n=1 Tax=Hexamita inflata TaxID=28002 RepID=A0AA86V4I8_9EUKA|nr:Hypothetical protein HINF_LOCUS63722 [Hexamita inflata]